ncbi:MAG: hypothetical protein EHM42_00935 [Planctomycetaceae bacterium]|nr:MAG: hypothetical protein EHM42_00935 [Planctomycetaceae bacterium]
MGAHLPLTLAAPILAASRLGTLLANSQVQFALRVLALLAPAFVGLFLMLPRGGRRGSVLARALGGALITGSLALLVTVPLPALGAAVAGSQATILWSLPDTLTCYTFHALALVSVASAVLMITSRNPVYSALWFALVLLGNSGLYLLQRAEFLAAATIIVYAGAIVVTFLFVIMLAQPNGAAAYDRQSREALMVSLTGLLLGGVLLGAIHQVMVGEGRGAVAGKVARPSAVVVANVADTQSATVRVTPETHVRGLGKTLFLDHVVGVEITGVLLLAAVVGAMMIAGHRIEESHVRK